MPKRKRGIAQSTSRTAKKRGRRKFCWFPCTQTPDIARGDYYYSLPVGSSAVGEEVAHTHGKREPETNVLLIASNAHSSPPKSSTAQHPHGDIDIDREYKLRTILDETKTHYLIDWEDDSETGEQFEPSWEPKANANPEAVSDWKSVKAAKAALRRESAAAASVAPSTPASDSEKPRKRLKRGRPRKSVVESSPAPEPELAPQEVLEIGESQDATLGAERELEPQSGNQSPLFVSIDGSSEPARPTASVHVSDPPSSFAAGGYDRFSGSLTNGTQDSQALGEVTQITSNSTSSAIAPRHEPQAPEQSQPAQEQGLDHVVTNSNETANNSSSATVLETRKTPEPSQYIPDLAETSKSTNETTDFSADPTTPSQQIQTELEVGETVVTTVPDSQSFPDSSSFVPKFTQEVTSIETSEQSAQRSAGHGKEAEAPQGPQGTQQPDTAAAQVSTEEPSHDTNQNAQALGPDQAAPASSVGRIQDSSQIQGLETRALSESAQETFDQHLASQPPPRSTADEINDFFESAISSTNPADLQTRELQQDSQNTAAAPVPAVEASQQSQEKEGGDFVVDRSQVQSAQSDSQDLYRNSVPPRQQSRSLQSQPAAESQEKNLRPQPQVEVRTQSAFASQEEELGPQQRPASSLDLFKQFHNRPVDKGSTEKDQERAAVVHSDSVPTSYQAQYQSQPLNSSNQRRNSDNNPIPISSGQPMSSDSNFNQRSALLLGSATASGPASQAVVDNNFATIEQCEQYPQQIAAGLGDQQILIQSQITGLLAAADIAGHQAVEQANPLQRSTGTGNSSSFPFATQVGTSVRTGETPAQHRAPLPGHRSQPAPFTQPQGQERPEVSLPSQPQALHSLPVPSSSSFPSIPTHSPLTFGESAPRRPQTPSTTDIGSMQSSPQSGEQKPTSLAARLKAMREANRARRSQTPVAAAQTTSEPVRPTAVPPRLTSPAPSALPARLTSPAPAEGARSPSAVPVVEPQPIVSQEDQNTSERYHSLVPQAHANGHDTVMQNGNSTHLQASDDNDTTMSAPDDKYGKFHVVPIALIGHQRDQYPETVWYKRNLIERYLAADTPNEELTQGAEEFVEQMKRIVNHPDLDNAETLTQYDVSPSQQANWDIQCSAKFRFLDNLIRALKASAPADSHFKLVVLTSYARLASMLFNFCKSLPAHVYLELEEEHSSQLEGPANITIHVSSVSEPQSLQTSGADFVIAFDGGTAGVDPIKQLSRYEGNDGIKTLLQLIVPCSVEHIERRLAPFLSTRARLRALLSGIFRLRSQAGRLEDDQVPPREAATAIVDYQIAYDDKTEWPLATLSRLDQLDSQTESELEPLSSDFVGGGESQEAARAGDKRSFNAADIGVLDSDPSKRMRAGTALEAANIAAMPVTINPQELDITHVSDSVDKPTQGAPLGSSLPSMPMSDTERRLRQLVKETQDRLDEHVRALSELQYRHEDQRNELVDAAMERDNAITTATAAMNRVQEQDALIKATRGERNDLNASLAQANERLLSHAVPERAELEAIRLGKNKAETEVERLQTRLESANGELEYMRTMYQDTSSKAQALAQQNTQLENELAVSQNKATGTQVELKRMGMDTFTKKLRAENKKLLATLKDRENGLRLRDEEISRLKEAGRGRMSTRATSVPRSPRMGSPLKAGASSNGGGSNSRQDSPSASELRGRAAGAALLHPLRNG